MLANLPTWKVGFKGFEALHNTVLDIDDHLLRFDIQMLVGQMYDELWQLFEMFERNNNKLSLNVECKKNMHLRQMTLHDIFKQYNMNPDFCQKHCKLDQDAYLSGRLMYSYLKCRPHLQPNIF